MRSATTAPPLSDYLSLDVRQLSRDGYLKEGSRKRMAWRVDGGFVGPVVIAAGSDFVDIFDEASTPGRTRLGASVNLTMTTVTYGTRRWFACPECDRRCALIYIDDIEGLMCRICLGAPYLSASLGKSARLQDRRNKARRALFMDGSGQAHRPKGMHTDTWLQRWKKLWAIEDAIARSLGDFDA